MDKYPELTAVVDLTFVNKAGNKRNCISVQKTMVYTYIHFSGLQSVRGNLFGS